MHRIQIMSADRNECSAAADILMEFLLEIDEALEADFVEGNIAEDGAGDKWADGHNSLVCDH